MSARAVRAVCVVLAAGVVSLLAGCATTTSEQAGVPEGDLVFTSWGGVYQEAQDTAIIKPYEADHPELAIVEDSPYDYSKIKQMVDNRAVTWDVVDVDPFFPLGNCGTYAQPLDYSVIDTSTIDPRLVSECGVPAITFATVLAYDTTKYGQAGPQSWSDFFDTTKFPGTRALNSGPQGGAMEIALLADGVAPEDLYPLDYARAFRKLDSLGDNLIFWDSGAQGQQMMETHETDMIAVWNGRGYFAAKNGATFVPVWNQPLISYDAYMVVAGAPHPEEAMRLIAYALTPQAQGRFQSEIPYAAVNSQATPSTGDALFKTWLNSPDHVTSGVLVDQPWWASHQKSATTNWIGWFAG
jgi:putative spermidine/putrescine transport system substrate-binding protein